MKNRLTCKLHGAIEKGDWKSKNWNLSRKLEIGKY